MWVGGTAYAAGMGGSLQSGAGVRVRMDPAERSEQILAVAAVRFRRDGYAGVSMDQVAADAGVARGLVNHYFGSKRELFLAVVQRDVRVPRSVSIVPDGASGDLESIVAVCVKWWLELVEVAGGLWPGSAGAGGFQDADVDDALVRARDELVERMIDEVPFPDVDRTLLRSALRCFAASARVATDEWIATGELTRSQAEALLRTSLLDLVQRSVPAMEAAEGG